MTDTTRDAFEVWATKQGCGITRDTNEYCGILTEFVWEAWQAATLEERERSAVELENVKARLAAFIEDTKEGR